MSEDAATEHFGKRSEEEIETYFRAYEQTPLTDDELDLVAWNEQHFGETGTSCDAADRGA